MSPSDEAVCDSTARRGDPRSKGHVSAPSYSFELQIFFLIPPYVPPMTCTCPTSSEILQSECPSIFSLSGHYTPTFEHVCLPNLERLQMRRLPEIAVRNVGSRIMPNLDNAGEGAAARSGECAMPSCAWFTG